MLPLKCLVIGDPHFKVDNALLTDSLYNELDALLDSYQKSDVDTIDFIVVLGDVLDRHEKISMNPLYRATNFMNMLSQYAPTYCLVGNHDRRNNSVYLTDEHALSPFKGKQNLYIVDVPITVEIKNKKLLFVPYVPTGRFDEAINLNNININDYLCVFAHQEFKGVKMGHIISESKDEWKPEYPLLISGHIHDYSELQNNLIYVGTPIQHGFNENSAKTVSVFEFVGLSFNQKRIELNIPRKIQLKLTVDELQNFVPDQRNIYKIIIEANDIASVKILPKVQELEKQGIRVQIRSILQSESIKVDRSTSQNKTKIKFKDILISTLQSESDEIKDLFNELFE